MSQEEKVFSIGSIIIIVVIYKYAFAVNKQNIS